MLVEESDGQAMGDEVFKFNTPKKRGGMLEKALNSPRTPQTPRTPRGSIKKKIPTTPKTPKNSTKKLEKLNSPRTPRLSHKEIPTTPKSILKSMSFILRYHKIRVRFYIIKVSIF